MLTINKLVSTSAVDYAAEELKKYLRMMLPEGGDYTVRYAPDAKDGYRLGLMQELGLDVSDVEDAELDDVIYIDCTARSGIIAGSNPRSVLLAVYEYLRRLGCRWLFPGVDGEIIPIIKDVPCVTYRHKASMRYRGWCNEGAEYQQNMLEAIDFLAKVGMNVFMMEFRIPTSYYNRYYDHFHNTENRPEESVTFDTILRWKRQCEAELSKRGLQFHDIGHGWGTDAFGIDSSVRKNGGKNDAALTDEQRQYLALTEGRRQLRNDTPNYTQFCMGNEEAMEKVVKYVCDYAESHSNADYFHVWLGDGNLHCTCERCRDTHPSDFYVKMLNMIDAELTRRKLTSRIVFIAYGSTIWPPEYEKLINQDRFTLLFAPISRSYTSSIPEVMAVEPIMPYNREAPVLPSTVDGCFSYLDGWRKMWHGSNIAYEYHFWRHQYFDLGGTKLSRIVSEDVKKYLKNGVSGIIEDGSQRSFFPTALTFYTYARTLFDTSLSYEEILEDCFSHLFGEGWREFYSYLDELSDAFDFEYISAKKSSNPEIGRHYNPDIAKQLSRVREITARGRELIKKHYTLPERTMTYAVRLLELHADYADLLADAVAAKAVGDDALADELYNKFRLEMGKREVYFQTCFDHTLCIYSLNFIFERRTNNALIMELDN